MVDTLILHSGDKIMVYGETTNTMEVIVSVEEYFDPNQIMHNGVAILSIVCYN